MLRTEIFTNQQGILTTKLLDEYKITQEQMIKNSTAKFYIFDDNCNPMNLPKFNSNFKITKDYIEDFTLSNPEINKDVFNVLFSEISYLDEINKNEKAYPILPLLAWGKNKKIDFFSTINIAKKLIHNYTDRCYEFKSY